MSGVAAWSVPTLFVPHRPPPLPDGHGVMHSRPNAPFSEGDLAARDDAGLRRPADTSADTIIGDPMSSKANTSAADRPAAKTSAGTMAIPVGSSAGFWLNGIEAVCQNLPAAEVLR